MRKDPSPDRQRGPSVLWRPANHRGARTRRRRKLERRSPGCACRRSAENRLARRAAHYPSPLHPRPTIERQGAAVPLPQVRAARFPLVSEHGSSARLPALRRSCNALHVSLARPARFGNHRFARTGVGGVPHNPSINRTRSGRLRPPARSGYVQRSAPQLVRRSENEELAARTHAAFEFATDVSHGRSVNAFLSRLDRPNAN